MRAVRSLQVALCALLLLMPALLQAQSTTVILVRHAERLDGSSDPPLSVAGQARADVLAGALAEAGVTAIYTTQFARTRLTAEPLAKKLGITPRVVEGGSDTAAHAAEVARHIRAEDRGGVVLVVGHSNTVPAIVAALGAGAVGTISDDQYDHVFVVRIDGDVARVIRAGYPPR